MSALVALGREGKAALNLDAERAAASARIAQKLGTQAGKARYRRRTVIPEPVFGWIKHVLGFKRFSLRACTRSHQNGTWCAWRSISSASMSS